MKKLDKDEFVEADHGYKGQPDEVHLPFKAQNKTEIRRKERACARHKGMNKLSKQFKALGTCWRHDIKKGRHKAVFDVVAIITQISMDVGAIKSSALHATNRRRIYEVNIKLIIANTFVSCQ